MSQAIADNGNGVPVDEDAELDRRAAAGSMVVTNYGPGMFEVFSGEAETYVVDIREGRCECPDHKYRGRTCKHIRRVEQSIGEREIPDDVRVDPTLKARREGRR